MIERLVWRALFGGRRRPRSVFPRLFRSPPPNPTETGRAGEQMVASWMKRELPASIYRSFHDLMLPAPDGMTQIDHVFVSRFGVFVVETKNMGGWIFRTRAIGAGHKCFQEDGSSNSRTRCARITGT